MLLSRYLPWTVLAAAGVLLLALWAAGTLRTIGAALPSGIAAVGEPDHVPQTHYVGPRQLAHSNAMLSQEAGDLQATAQDGRRLRWHDLSGGRPVVLVFIKDGCPCNVKVEPLFQRVEKLYPEEARFAGVIDAGTAAARRYATEQAVSHPVLADAEHELILLFGAEAGCHVVLLTPGGVIDGCWPGCSATTLQQLGRRIARLAGVAERPLDMINVPASLTTGCRFVLR
jgi:peroxiredoxin